MKKNAKKFLSIILSILMLVSVMPLALAAADEPAYATGYMGLGDYAAPALGEGGEGEGTDAEIPADFSLVSNMPAARDQNPFGSCWAFGTVAAVESNLIMQGLADKDDLDLSEMQLIYYMYHPTVDPLGNITAGEGGYCADGELINGGRSDYAMNVLAHWNGIAAEPDDEDDLFSYDNTYPVSANAVPGKLDQDWDPALATDYNEYLIKDYYAINLQDADLLKAAIIENGAASVGYTHFYNCIYEGENTVNYYSGTDPYSNTGSGGGHAVAIVGWDDNYSKENFGGKFQPANDGAWLIRNSWGDDWGMNGYFWMSYDEKTMDSTAFITIMQKADAYDNNYFFDGGSMYHPSTKVFGAVNKFTANGNELLKAVSVVFPEDANVNYTVDIYAAGSENDLSEAKNASFASWEPVASAHTEGTTTFAGMYTIELANAVPLAAGQKFAVAIRADKPVVVSYDKPNNTGWFRNSAFYEPDCSYFISSSDKLISMEERGVARIKAYTENYVEGQTVTIRLDDLQLNEGDVIAPADYITVDPESAALTFTAADEAVVSVAADGTVTALAAGETVLEARCADTNTRATAAITVSHVLTDVAAAPATCTEAGNAAYKKCEKCGKLFVNGAEVSAADVAVAPAGHAPEAAAAVEATDYTDGSIAYWYCPVCEKYFRDEACTEEIALADTVIPAPYTREKVAAKAADCTTDGNVEYYVVNDKATGDFVKYVDASGNEIADPVIRATGHDMAFTAAKEPTCTAAGNIAYYTCANCGLKFADEEGAEQITGSVSLPATGHNMEAHPKKAATCTEPGNEQYYYCTNCEKFFKYQTGNGELDVSSADELVIPAAHTLYKIDAREPNCYVPGNIEYYVCKVCGVYFADADASEAIPAESVVRTVTHDWGEGEETLAPTCVVPGVTTYTCSICGEVKAEVIPAKGHDFQNGVCANCGLTEEEAAQSDIQELGGEICEYCGRRHGTSWFAKFLYAVHGVFKFFKDLFAKIG